MLVGEPDEVPELLEPLPMLGELLLLGDFVLLEPEPVELLPLLMPDEAPVEPLVVPDELPDAPLELDLLKCASHSARDTWPSLFLSTSEKFGEDELPEELELPPLAAGEEDDDEDGLLDEPDEPDAPDVLELPPLAAGEDEDEEDGVLEEPEADGVLEDEDDGLLDLSAELPLVAEGDEDDGLLDDDEDCATASVDSANITAAAVTLRVCRIKYLLEGG